MAELADIAIICRSKNAGPFLLTLDIVMPDSETYRRVVNSNVLTPERIATLYSVDVKDVNVVQFPLANAIKAVVPRLVSAGDVDDTDVYGAQQHAPLLDLEIA